MLCASTKPKHSGYWVGAGSCCSDLGVEHYGMADEIEFIENYKTHVASAVIMMQVGFLKLLATSSLCCVAQTAEALVLSLLAL